METKLATPLLNTVSGGDNSFDGTDTIAVSASAVGGHRGQAEDSPSYAVLAQHGLICATYRVSSVSNLDVTPPNTTRNEHTWQVGLSWLCLPLCGPCVFKALVHRFEVPSGHVRPVEDGRGAYYFAGPGLHAIVDLYARLPRAAVPIASGVITHGDRTIVTVEQGYIGFAKDKGQPVLLPPGLHQWRSPTLTFDRMIDLNSHVIRLGPYTLLTVDEGYCAVTQNNGRQVILEGGETHLLTHRNWKFEKFVSKKIQTNDLKGILATSADNVLMTVESTVAWHISDVEKAARMAAETMHADGSEIKRGEDTVKLRNDVLKQAEASLSSFIGTVNYSSTFGVSAQVSGHSTNVAQGIALSDETKDGGGGDTGAAGAMIEGAVELASPLFNEAALLSAVGHANQLTNTYGVTIISINIISAKPADNDLMGSLAKGAVAAAEAQQAETTAVGKARAARIEAEGRADAAIVLAKGEAEAERLRAEGARKAADLLASSDLAVDLARIDKTGSAISGAGGSTFFFGADASQLGTLLANPAVVSSQPRGATG